MRIAILSDIHDNVWNLLAALDFLRRQNTHALICCGDLCSPFVVGLMLDEKVGYSGPIHVVFGNNDADLYRITQQAVPGRLTFYGELAELVVEGEQLKPLSDPSTEKKRIAVNHFNYLARSMAASGKYDLIFYGHNHKHRHERLVQTEIINPGAIMGYDPGIKKGIPPTFIIYDTSVDDAPDWYQIKSSPDQATLTIHPYPKLEPEPFNL